MKAIEQARPTESTRTFIERMLREYLGDREEMIQDAVGEWLAGLDLPWWVPGFVVRRLVDWMIPDQVIRLVVMLLDRAGLE